MTLCCHRSSAVRGVSGSLVLFRASRRSLAVVPWTQFSGSGSRLRSWNHQNRQVGPPLHSIKGSSEPGREDAYLGREGFGSVGAAGHAHTQFGPAQFLLCQDAVPLSFWKTLERQQTPTDTHTSAIAVLAIE